MLMTGILAVVRGVWVLVLVLVVVVVVVVVLFKLTRGFGVSRNRLGCFGGSVLKSMAAVFGFARCVWCSVPLGLVSVGQLNDASSIDGRKKNKIFSERYFEVSRGVNQGS
jgi:uncharacterized membrane protein